MKSNMERRGAQEWEKGWNEMNEFYESAEFAKAREEDGMVSGSD